jgi:hypothetical protein
MADSKSKQPQENINSENSEEYKKSSRRRHHKKKDCDEEMKVFCFNTIKGEKGECGSRGPRGLPGKEGRRGERGPRGKRGYMGPSLIWRGEWKENEEYCMNDLVRYNGSTYIAINKNCNIVPTSENMVWDLFAASGTIFTWKGEWVEGTSYHVNDVVQYNGSTYIAIANTTTQPPSADWDLMAMGQVGPEGPAGPPGVSFIWKGPWVDNVSYLVNDVVESNGSSYIAVINNINIQPPSPVWNLMARGV